jgi:hypothetical protein
MILDGCLKANLGLPLQRRYQIRPPSISELGRCWLWTPVMNLSAINKNTGQSLFIGFNDTDDKFIGTPTKRPFTEHLF